MTIRGKTDLSGAKSILNSIANNLPQDSKFKKIIKHLKPQNILQRIFRRKGELQQEITKIQPSLDQITIDTIKTAAGLRKAIEQSDTAGIHRDPDNANLQVATGLVLLSNQIEK